jgi:hypothetical protein
MVPSNNLPSEIGELYANKEVSSAHHMALGPNGTYVFVYKPKGRDGTAFAVDSLPPALHEWICAKNA